MCNLIVDANIFKAFYEEEMGQQSPRPERTAAAKDIFNYSGNHTKSFLDEGCQIEQEWRNQCLNAIEWFDAWLAENLSNGKIVMVDAAAKKSQAIKCHAEGFPKKSRDIWYIKTAYAAQEANEQRATFIVTEDIDFYDPASKKSTKKKKIIEQGKGPVAKHLSKHKITVSCLSTYVVHGC